MISVIKLKIKSFTMRLTCLREAHQTYLDHTATALLMAFAFFSSWHREFGQILYNLILCLWLIGGYYRKSLAFLKTKPGFMLLLLFIIWLIIGRLWSEDPRYGKVVCHRYAYFLLIYIFAALINAANMKRITMSLLSGLVFIFLTSYLIQFNMLPQDDIDMFPAWKVRYQDFSFYLGVMCLAGSFFILKRLQEGNWKGGVFGVVLMLPIMLRLLSAKGRGAFVGTIIGLIVLFFLQIKKNRMAAVTVMFIVVAATVGFGWTYSTTFRARAMNALQGVRESTAGSYVNSVGIRLAYYDIGLHLIAGSPLLGVGTGGHRPAFATQAETYKDGLYAAVPRSFKNYHFHNDYIEIAVQTGLIGLCLYLLFMVYLIKDARGHSLFPLITSLLTLFWVNGISDVVFVHDVVIFFMAIALALSIQERTPTIFSKSRA